MSQWKYPCSRKDFRSGNRQLLSVQKYWWPITSYCNLTFWNRVMRRKTTLCIRWVITEKLFEKLSHPMAMWWDNKLQEIWIFEGKVAAIVGLMKACRASAAPGCKTSDLVVTSWPVKTVIVARANQGICLHSQVSIY